MSIASRMASANVSWRLVMHATASGEHVRAELGALWERALPRERDRVIDLRGDRGVHLGIGGRIDEAVVLEQPAVQPDRVACHPGVELGLRAVTEMDVAERAAMLEPAVGHELDERRTGAAADLRDGIGGRGGNRLDQLTVVLPG